MKLNAAQMAPVLPAFCRTPLIAGLLRRAYFFFER